NESEDEGSPREDIAERADQKQTASVAGLHERRHRRYTLEADAKCVGHAVEDGLTVVEVGHGDPGGLKLRLVVLPEQTVHAAGWSVYLGGPLTQANRRFNQMVNSGGLSRS